MGLAVSPGFVGHLNFLLLRIACLWPLPVFSFFFLFVAGTEYFRVVGVVESEVAISHGLRWVIIVTVFTSA